MIFNDDFKILKSETGNLQHYQKIVFLPLKPNKYRQIYEKRAKNHIFYNITIF
jgi:hypothetical protein